MFHSSWNSMAYQEYCAMLPIVERNGGYSIHNPLTDQYSPPCCSQEEAVKARRMLYDGQLAHICNDCGRANNIVNACCCDPNNLPTKPNIQI